MLIRAIHKAIALLRKRYNKRWSGDLSNQRGNRGIDKMKNPTNQEIHYTETDMTAWRWKNFTPKEIASKGDGLLMVNEDAMDALQTFREMVGVAFTPNSAYRSVAHNKAVGGSPNSMHLQGRAFDIPIKSGMSRMAIHKFAKQAGFTGFGDYDTFVHIDTGRSRYWDMRKS